MTAMTAVPANEATDPPLDRSSARVRRLAVCGLWLQGLYVLWACASGWFHADDFVFRGQGAGYPWLDPEYLFQPWGGHLMPAGFALAQAFAKPGNFAYGAIVLSLAAGQSLVAYLLYRTLTRHFGYRWRILALLGVYLVSIPVLQATVWWVSALNALPYLACLVLIADRALRWSTAPAAAHLWWIWGLQLAALAFFEKAVLGFLLIPMLLWTLSPELGGWAAVRDVARRAWGLWAGLGLLLAGWAALFLSNRTSDMAAPPDTAIVSDQLWYGLIGTFLPSLLGGPWSWQASGALDGYARASVDWRLACVTLALALGAGLWLASWGVRARRALVTVVVYAVVLVVLLNVGRQTFLVATSNLPRYYADLTVVTVLCLAVASTRLRHDPAPDLLHERALPRPDRRSAIAVAAVANLVLIANLWSSSTLVRGVAQSPERSYAEQVVADLHQLGPDRQVVDGAVPAEIMGPLGSPYNSYSWFFAGLPGAARIVADAAELLVIDDEGRVGPGAVVGPTSVPGPDLGCGYRVRSQRSVPLDAQVIPWRHVVALDYSVPADSELEVSMAGGDPVVVPLRAGTRQAFFPIDGGGTSVLVRRTGEGTPVCVSRIVVGAAVPTP